VKPVTGQIDVTRTQRRIQMRQQIENARPLIRADAACVAVPK